ncbi:ABC transporter substrate-binding protein [Sinomonas sp. JGH33]|uniref:ABC transporter substrate-binding protein n=1 Tax=Sinomonas terricola TaxID=3110330 RepID=A0ABU5T708_9MICC|nr:ABC transporter substrate-binding protein [Sinomonas sp. JGH33]MEA5455463.1 ABC transporter substrate-binding protein [Sinomonas sp. JGH33]
MKITARKGLALGAALLTATLALSACEGSAQSAQTGATEEKKLVVSTFPFGVDAFKKAVVEPFTKATGIEVEVETGSNADRISKLGVNKNSGVDVMLISDFYAAVGQSKGLFDKVDPAKVPNMAKVAKFATDGALNGPAYTFQLNGMMYRTDVMDAAKAAKWNTLADPANARKISLPDYAATSGQLTLSGISAAYGSGPFDVDKGFAKLGTLAPSTLKFYSSSTEVTNLIQQKEIVLAPALDGFASSLVSSGAPVAWTPAETGKYMSTNRAMIVKGTEHPGNSAKFIDYLLSAEAQSAAAAAYGDKPVDPDAKLPDLLTKVSGPAAKDPIAAGFTVLDMDPIVQNRAAWVERYAREVTSK